MEFQISATELSFYLHFAMGEGIKMYVIIIISKDPDIVGTTPIYVHYKR